MKVLVISDDTWHPAEVVEMGLAPLKRKFDMTCICTAKDIHAEVSARIRRGDGLQGGLHQRRQP